LTKLSAIDETFEVVGYTQELKKW